MVELTLRGRCSEFLAKRYAASRISVEDLTAFVVSETGRTADERLNEALPLCLYFQTEEDRDGFIRDFHEVKPNAVTKKVP